jgi:hypothetical protein
MFTTVMLLALAALAMAGRRDHHERDRSSSSSSSSSSSNALGAAAALAEANALLAAARANNAQAAVGEELSGIRVLSDAGSSSSSDSESSVSTSSVGSSTQLSTSDRLHIAVEERLIEAAIRQAVAAPPAASTLQKKAFQARYEITAFENGERLRTEALSFGPTVISTRRNYFLANTGRDTSQVWTMGDFLDANSNGEPDIITALKTFRSTANPAEYLRVLRNRASSAPQRLETPNTGGGLDTASVDLINLIRLDGRFSVTNHLLSPCFSATNEPEFVFETLVGLAAAEFNDGARLSAAPTKTADVLLAGSTAVNGIAEPLLTFQELRDRHDPKRDFANQFFDFTHNEFKDTLTIPLFLNVVPDQLIPGAEDPAVQGRVVLSACQSFSYFN